MTALNLRLGLWVRHPAAEAADARRWPGVLLYREMFSLTSSSGPVALVEGSGADVPRLMRDVHLSDGGHFENLALYELIRRHCRYVLLCDCGQDQTVAFDDLGNALRRIREDFGVDITIDVSPLRPGAEPPGQAARGGRVDSLLRDRPRHPALHQAGAHRERTARRPAGHSTRNTAFPHESTGDQFYDEAQVPVVSTARLPRRRRDLLVRAASRRPRERPSREVAAGGGAAGRRDRGLAVRASDPRLGRHTARPRRERPRHDQPVEGDRRGVPPVTAQPPRARGLPRAGVRRGGGDGRHERRRRRHRGRRRPRSSRWCCA